MSTILIFRYGVLKKLIFKTVKSNENIKDLNSFEFRSFFLGTPSRARTADTLIKSSMESFS